MTAALTQPSATPCDSPPARDWRALIGGWALELGFSQCGFTDLDVAEAEGHLQRWLDQGMHGEMDYMARHAALRADPARLLPGARSAIMVTMDYAPADPRWREQAWATLSQPERAFVSRYALGRDYHKVVRGRLARLTERIAAELAPLGARVCCDSAPVFEVELARKAGLGWRGKHTLLLSRSGGSAFFIGTLLTDLALPADAPQAGHCGRCRRCIDVCPTGAIVAPYQLDARRCIAYLTIESDAPIPTELRAQIGNRIFGCDDCQLVCPWNRFARPSVVDDFAPRAGLDSATLVDLLGWSAEAFEQRTRGSAIRRIGLQRWRRNLIVALGNALAALPVDSVHRPPALAALAGFADGDNPLLAEHARWALGRAPE